MSHGNISLKGREITIVSPPSNDLLLPLCLHCPALCILETCHLYSLLSRAFALTWVLNFPRNSKEEIGKSAAPINQLNNVPLYGYITFYPFISWWQFRLLMLFVLRYKSSITFMICKGLLTLWIVFSFFFGGIICSKKF